MNKPDFKKETRFALVLYGGVSLAVYIFGVSNEFFNMTRGRRVYGLLKILFNTDIVVDIISGTSAGGINGIFLANALANEKKFESTAELWRKKGGLSDLLRGVNDPLETYKSLLNSEGYYFPSLRDAFKKLNSDGNKVPELIDPLKSKITNLDLFVTGTNLEGNFFLKIDDSNNKIEYKDHRSVFKLKYRDLTGYYANQFNANDDNYINGIAKLAQITSCFPFAFAPVHVGNQLQHDELLNIWGNLNGSNYFVDGGVLDNKPFGHTIKAIFTKKAEKIVERHLVFVEPDPIKEQKKEKFSEPDILQVVKMSTNSIPGYESISDDLNMIIERNQKITQINEFTENLSFIDSDCCKDGKDEIYIRARLSFDVNKAVDLVINNNLNFKNTDERVKIKTAQDLMNFLKLKILASVENYIRPKDSKDDDVINIEEIFLDMDVYYRLRRIYSVIYKLYDTIEEYYKKVGEYNYEFLQLWKNLNTIASIYEIIKSTIEKKLSELVIQTGSAKDIWNHILYSLRLILDESNYDFILEPDNEFNPDFEKIRQNLSILKTSLDETDINYMYNYSPLFREDYDSILKYLENFESKLLEKYGNDSLLYVKKFYNNYIKYDCKVFPLEVMSDIYEKDIIKFHRFSPFDCQKGFSQRSAFDKITGNELHHFGAFLKRSWRSNDIMWGRIDSVGGLVSIFFSKDKTSGKNNFSEILHNQAERENLKRIFFNDKENFNSEYKIRNFFTNANDYTCITIQNLLKKLILNFENYNGHEDKLDKDIEKLETLLIETEQLEIFKEEFKNVAADALEEQFLWNNEQALTNAPKSPNDKNSGTTESENNINSGEEDRKVPWRFKSIKKNIDKFISQNFVENEIDEFISKKTLKDERALPTESKFGKYLSNDYSVGTEKLSEDIPYVVILHIISRILLITKNIVLNLLAQRKKKVPQKLMTLLVSFPLKTFYHLTSIMQRSFGFGMGIFVTTNLFCLVLLCLRFIYVKGLGSSGFGEIFFTFIPLIFLSFSTVIIYYNKKKYLIVNLSMIIFLLVQLFFIYNPELWSFYTENKHWFVLAPIAVWLLSVIIMLIKRYFFKVKW